MKCNQELLLTLLKTEKREDKQKSRREKPHSRVLNLPPKDVMLGTDNGTVHNRPPKMSIKDIANY